MSGWAGARASGFGNALASTHAILGMGEGDAPPEVNAATRGVVNTLSQSFARARSKSVNQDFLKRLKEAEARDVASAQPLASVESSSPSPPSPPPPPAERPLQKGVSFKKSREEEACAHYQYHEEALAELSSAVEQAVPDARRQRRRRRSRDRDSTTPSPEQEHRSSSGRRRSHSRRRSSTRSAEDESFVTSSSADDESFLTGASFSQNSRQRRRSRRRSSGRADRDLGVGELTISPRAVSPRAALLASGSVLRAAGEAV